MINDIKVTGKIDLVLFGADGVEKERREVNNTIVGTGLLHIARRLLEGDDMPPPMKYMGLGTNGTASNPSNVALLSEITGGTRASCLVTKDVSSPKIVFKGTFDSGTYTNPTISEAGIFDHQLPGEELSLMLCRVAFTQIDKTADDTLSITWTITIS